MRVFVKTAIVVFSVMAINAFGELLARSQHLHHEVKNFMNPTPNFPKGESYNVAWDEAVRDFIPVDELNDRWWE